MTALNWGYLVFLWLLVIVEMLDIRLILDALSIAKEMKSSPNPDPEDKLTLSHRIWQATICTALVASGIAVIVFFVLEHL